MNNAKKYPYRILCIDILIVALIILVAIFVSKGMYTYHSPFSKTTSVAIYVPFAMVVSALAGFILFVEYKYNKLNLKNIFLILGLVVAINNTIATLATPSTVFIEYAKEPYIIHPADKVYSIIYGYIVALFPFLLAFLMPKKINNKKYLNIALYVFAGLVSLTVLASFIFDREAFLLLFKGNIDGFFNKSIGSVFKNKNNFGWFLFAGMISAMTLHIINKKWYWLIPLGIFYIFIIFTFSKSAMIVGTLLLLTYLIANLVFIAKKSKENLIITLLVSLFVIVFASVVIVLTVNSQSGLLLKIKELINKALEQGRLTISTRMLIWQTTLRLLKPYQFVFGFGMAIVGKAISIAYGSHPDCIEKPATGIVNAHNSFIEIIAEGGAIYLLVYIAYLVILFYMAVKIYKHNKMFSIMSITYLILFMVLGITGQAIIFGDTTNIFFSIWIVVPLASVYYMYSDKEKANRDLIIKEAKEIKDKNFSSKILNFNKKRILLNAKHIQEDLMN